VEVEIMAWSTIRKATEEDWERLSAAARTFIERHLDEFPYLKLDDPEVQRDYVFALEGELDYRSSDAYDHEMKCRRLGRLWRRCVRRALRDGNAEGIAYGYVGQSVD
jgi:hypothetical protein